MPFRSDAVAGSAAPEAVDSLLIRAREVGASDLHIDPEEGRLRVRARRDGVLEPLADLPAELAATVIGRLKSLADMLVYRTDLPAHFFRKLRLIRFHS